MVYITRLSTMLHGSWILFVFIRARCVPATCTAADAAATNTDLEFVPEDPDNTTRCQQVKQSPQQAQQAAYYRHQ